MTSRRTVIGASLSAVPAGIGAALGIRQWSVAGTSLRLLGQNASMLCLFDTGNERVLFLLGSPDPGLLENLSQLLPIGRQRLDLIVGSHYWLTARGVRNHLDLNTIATLSLQASASTPPLRGKVHPITSTLEFVVGENCAVALSIGRDENESGDNPDFTAEISAHETRLVLANRAEALSGVNAGLHLLVVPGEVQSDRIQRYQPELFLGTSLHQGFDIPEVQVFPNDAVILSIRDGFVTIRKDQFFS